MARPSVEHKGFFVPNAKDVAKPELAEPDRIDFNTVAHARWGVIDGCEVSVTGTTASNTVGTALVNGKLLDVPGGQPVSVGSSTQDRFYIVGVNDRGVLVAIPGTESPDPVFPDVPLDVTALAAVLCTAGGSNYADNVIDKRKFLADSLLTKIPAVNTLISNRNGSGNLYKVDGGGITSWSGDTIIQRHSAGVLQISTSLQVDDTITAGGFVNAKAVVATDRIIGSNLRNGSTVPANGDGHAGDIFQHTGTGLLYIHQGGKWEEIATIKSGIPMGTIITSLVKPESMAPGWIPLDGQASVKEQTEPELFALLDSWSWPRSGTSPNLVITTRNASKRMLMVDFEGVAGALGGSSSIVLGLNNLPEHKHNVKAVKAKGEKPVITLQKNGQHNHSVTGGAHGHDEVEDPGHAHHGADHYMGGAFVCTSWGGTNKLDALFNDRSHTYSVEVAEFTRKAQTGIKIGSGGSTHVHTVTQNGDHDHEVDVKDVDPHSHNINEDPVGIGAPLPFTPAHITVYCYIRS